MIRASADLMSQSAAAGKTFAEWRDSFSEAVPAQSWNRDSFRSAFNDYCSVAAASKEKDYPGEARALEMGSGSKVMESSQSFVQKALPAVWKRAEAG